MTQAVFTKAMVNGWQHSEPCLAHSKPDQCICGLTSMQAAAPARGHFYLLPQPCKCLTLPTTQAGA